MARKRGSPQPEQNVMRYHATATTNYLDIAAGLACVNRKQYHQTKSLKPLLYHVRAQCITLGADSDPIEFGTAANSWTTRNAVVMLGAMYRKQLRDNGIRISQLPKYGREMRLALATNSGYTHGSGADGFGQEAYPDSTSLGPLDHAGNTLFASYTNSDGVSVAFATGNELTVISVPEPEADGEPETVVSSLTGTTDHGANDLAVIPEYLAARRNADDSVEADSHFPSDDNLLMRIGASSDEHFDEVIQAVESTGDKRPYNEAGANLITTQGILAAAGDYCSFVAPLGLIQVKGNADSKFLMTVSAITQM